jgi:natural product biosynthesis luciferase-like monooxygenase protein
MNDLAKRLSALSPEQRRLFEQLRADAMKADAIDLLHRRREGVAGTRMKFSLFFFAEDGGSADSDKYDLLLKSARFADRGRFSAIWTPERHFHPFGGPYPCPAVLGGAIAAVTDRIGIRAGSVVLPLNDPIRVAEAWSVVDNLSRGRVAIACASGWHIDDFVLAPSSYSARKERMREDVDVIQRLWRGETITRVRPDGDMVEVRLFPEPVQPQLPIWITSSGNQDTFELAGTIGANVLTSLIGQSLGDLERKIKLYRAALTRHGRDPDKHIVTVMLHTFVGDSVANVRDLVLGPMLDYLRVNLRLQKSVLPEGAAAKADGCHEQELLDFAFNRYFEEAALFGTVESCGDMVVRLARSGVDEIACLIDFGLSHGRIYDGLAELHQLMCAFDGDSAAFGDRGLLPRP